MPNQTAVVLMFLLSDSSSIIAHMTMRLLMGVFYVLECSVFGAGLMRKIQVMCLTG